MSRELDREALQELAVAEITVCGYPRSGNVWVCRLLGEVLDVPVVGIQKGRDSLAAEGQERTGKGYVRQAHLWPGKKGHLRVNLQKHKGHIFLHMVRDPRDVAVSASHFWDWDIDETLDKMIDGPGPLELPPWSEYEESWLSRYVPILRFEDFHRDTYGELGRVLTYLGLRPQKDLADVVEHQSFAAKKAELERRGNRYPFGRVAQLKHLRKGLTGEWRDVLSREQTKRAARAWEPLLKRLGYD
jgi:hypothetical protein